MTPRVVPISVSIYIIMIQKTCIMVPATKQVLRLTPA